MPVAANVVAFSLQNGRIRLEREGEGGARQSIELPAPATIAAGKGLNTPRYPKFPDIMKARKKTIERVALADLALPQPTGAVTVLRLAPAVEARKRIHLQGTAQEAVDRLVETLRNVEKVL
jgi:electron transfer flavoprotein beta subunit